jgi:hypothetical protein
VNDNFEDTVYSGFIIRFRDKSDELTHLLFPNGKPFQCTALAKREIITSITCREKIKAISAYNKNRRCWIEV